MLKRSIVYQLLLLFSIHHTNPLTIKPIIKRAKKTSVQNPDKTQRLHDLERIARHINQTDHEHEFTVTVPHSTAMSAQDIFHFLGSAHNNRKNVSGIYTKQKSIKLNHLDRFWRQIAASYQRTQKIDETSSKLLEQIREAIEITFKNNMFAPNNAFTTFIQHATKQKISLILRPSGNETISLPKPFISFHAEDIYINITNIVTSCYQDDIVEQLLQQSLEPQDLLTHIIIQTFIATEEADNIPLVSGIICSYDRMSYTQDIHTIDATYGYLESFKQNDIPFDTYYLYNHTIYPTIRKKTDRLIYNELALIQHVHNDKHLQEKSALTPAAVRAVDTIIETAIRHYKQSVCISFIKRNHTIYLIDLHLLPAERSSQPTYIDPLYIKKAKKDGAIKITPLEPIQEIIVLKNRSELILAADLKSFLELYNKQDEPFAKAGIIKHQPALLSKEMKLLNNVDIPVFYSSEFSHIYQWINGKKWPLIIDAQAELILPFKRKKGFCTLFQVIMSGLLHHASPTNISTVSSFVVPLTTNEKALLKADEFFSGVTLEHLFNLVKYEPTNVSLNALRSILYRLQTTLKRFNMETTQDSITTQHAALLFQYNYIEQVIYQLYKLIKNSKQEPGESTTQKLFLTNILKDLIMQQCNENIVACQSFLDLQKIH